MSKTNLVNYNKASVRACRGVTLDDYEHCTDKFNIYGLWKWANFRTSIRATRNLYWHDYFRNSCAMHANRCHRRATRKHQLIDYLNPINSIKLIFFP